MLRRAFTTRSELNARREISIDHAYLNRVNCASGSCAETRIFAAICHLCVSLRLIFCLC